MKRRVRGGVTRVAAAILVVVMLVGVLRAGDRYFYCPTMRAVIDAPCCAGDRHSDDDDTAALEVRSRDCCEEHRLGSLPSAAVAPNAAPFDAPVLAVLPPVTALSHPLSTSADPRFAHDNRAGPASNARHRAELMVFLN
jgi:hypothetical protein